MGFYQQKRCVQKILEAIRLIRMLTLTIITHKIFSKVNIDVMLLKPSLFFIDEDTISMTFREKLFSFGLGIMELSEMGD